MPVKRPKHLLIVGGGVFQVPAIKVAQSMELKVVVTDYNPEAEGMLLADYPIEVSTRNINLTVNTTKQFHRTCPLDGVLTVGTDASQTVAAVADALNLPGIPFEVAERATDKIKMRQVLQEKGVSVPDFRPIWTLEDCRQAIDDMPLPLVIKPCDNMGARGVRKIESIDDLVPAFREAKEASISGKLILEEFMEGVELSLDALVYENEIHITGVADRIIERAPYFVEVGHTLPSILPPGQQAQAVEVFKQAISALGIDIGAAKGDIKITSEGPKIVEIAARLSGGWMSAYTYPLATGVNLYKAAIQIALGGNPTDLTPKTSLVSAERSLLPPAGKILSIRGVEEAR
ncbi:ATP-grasp domain-containing protein, partial [Nitrospinae bacterium]|nr:ATP-grasp domain-containing protein [Nitrospinota bacterium]